MTTIMTTITGVVDATNTKDIRTKKGVFKKFGLKIGETWYNHFAKADPAVSRGDSVSFDATEGEYGWDIDPKTLKVSQGAQPARTGDGRQPAVSGAPSATERQIRVSHSMNVAAQILGPLSGDATGDDEREYYKALEAWAKRVLRLTQSLVANYDAIAAGKAADKAAPPAQPTPPPPPTPAAGVPASDGFDDDVPF